MAAPHSSQPADPVDARIPFVNLDDDAQFTASLANLSSPKTRNFAVRFNAREAYVAFDLEAPKWEDVLSTQVCYDIDPICHDLDTIRPMSDTVT